MALRKPAKILILITLVLIGVGIFLALQLGTFIEPDKSILTNSPCPPPCWYGIVPGESSTDLAWKALRQNPYVAPWTLHDLGSGDGVRFTWFNRPIPSKLSEIYSRGEIVQIIQVGSKPSIKLGDIVSKLGNPVKVLAWYQPTDNDVNQSYWIRLYFPQRGIVVSSNMKPIYDEGSPITPDMATSEIFYFKPTTLEGLFDTARSFTSVNSWDTDAQERLQGWQGFGLYHFALDPP